MEGDTPVEMEGEESESEESKSGASAEGEDEESENSPADKSKDETVDQSELKMDQESTQDSSEDSKEETESETETPKEQSRTGGFGMGDVTNPMQASTVIEWEDRKRDLNVENGREYWYGNIPESTLKNIVSYKTILNDLVEYYSEHNTDNNQKAF